MYNSRNIKNDSFNFIKEEYLNYTLIYNNKKIVIKD